MADSSALIKDCLDKVFQLHKDEKTKLENEIQTLKTEKLQLRKKIAQVNKEKDDDKQIVQKLNQKINRLTSELSEEKLLNNQLSQKLMQERGRVLGWKQKALASNNYSKSYKKKEINVDIYAPMTEQYSDEKGEDDDTSENDVFISVGETEHVPNEILLVNSDTDEGEPFSPSVLVKPKQNRQPSISNTNFETSDDLFAEVSSFEPKTSSARYKLKPPALPKHEINEIQINKINPLQNDEFTSSTPVISRKKLDINVDSNSFNTVKENNKANFKYVEVIRKKADREKLRGFTCHECEQFYANENLNDEQRKEIINRCSKHRYKETPPPSTPDDFWAVSFPSTQDYVARGLMEVEKTQTQKENRFSRDRTRKRIKYQ